MIPITPRGFKDVLPEEALWREAIINKVQATFASWGYTPIETPSLEVLSVLQLGGELSKTPFRLFDSDGALLVLRPDVTLPIARMVASRLEKVDEPLRFRYTQPVFREEESMRGQAREYTQIGIELIGEDGASSDAEVILLMVDALRACGLKEFTIAICTVGVLRELLSLIVKQGEATQEWQAEVLKACHQNNFVEVANLVRESGISRRYSEALIELLEISGKDEAIQRCKNLVEPLGCSDGLDNLARTYAVITELGMADFVRIDFSIMSQFDYYTGLVLEAYAPQVGVALGSGGRYNHMLEAFGTSAAAAGFAFSLDRVMLALLEQGMTATETKVEQDYCFVACDESDPASAFHEASRLRASGKQVLIRKSGQRGRG